MRPTPKTACDKTCRWAKCRFLIGLALRTIAFVVAVAALAELAGCSSTPTARLAVYDDREGGPEYADPLPELPDVVVQACDLLPVACEASGFHQLGIVQVHLWPDGMRRGRQLGGDPCWRAIGARASDPVAIAHELGHAFGLQYDLDHPGRLMDANADGVDPGMTYDDALTDREIRVILRNAGALEACRP